MVRVTSELVAERGLEAAFSTHLMSNVLVRLSALFSWGRGSSAAANGFTALHLAARDGLLDCIKVLVQSGANVHAQDSMGCKPIDYCKIWNHRACAR